MTKGGDGGMSMSLVARITAEMESRRSVGCRVKEQRRTYAAHHPSGWLGGMVALQDPIEKRN
jgi:hypothetical protein